MNEILKTLSKSTPGLCFAVLIFWVMTANLESSNKRHFEAQEQSKKEHVASMQAQVERLQEQADKCAEDRKDLWDEIIKLKE